MPVYVGTVGTTAATTCVTQGVGWLANATTATTATTPSIGQITYWVVQPGTVSATVPTWSNIPSPAEQWARQVRETNRVIAEYDAAYQEQVERAWRAQQYRVAEREQRRELRHEAAARDRANELLLEHLTPAQRQTFAKNQWFVVEGGMSKTRYRIRAKGSLVANIDVMAAIGHEGESKVVHRLCGHCDPRAMPLADHLLAQKLMLEFDEEEFLKIANRHAA